MAEAYYAGARARDQLADTGGRLPAIGVGRGAREGRLPHGRRGAALQRRGAAADARRRREDSRARAHEARQLRSRQHAGRHLLPLPVRRAVIAQPCLCSSLAAPPAPADVREACALTSWDVTHVRGARPHAGTKRCHALVAAPQRGRPQLAPPHARRGQIAALGSSRALLAPCMAQAARLAGAAGGVRTVCDDLRPVGRRAARWGANKSGEVDRQGPRGLW